MGKWAEAADAEAKAVKAVALVEAKTPISSIPELPPNLKRCLSEAKHVRPKQQKKQEQKPKADKQLAKVGEEPPLGEGESHAKKPPVQSADALVLARLEAARKRDACARLLLEWYGKNVKSPPKVAAAVKR